MCLLKTVKEMIDVPIDMDLSYFWSRAENTNQLIECYEEQPVQGSFGGMSSSFLGE